MEQEKKNQIIAWLKALALFVYALVTIAVCSASLNSRPGAFISIVTIALLATNGYVIYREARKLKP